MAPYVVARLWTGRHADHRLVAHRPVAMWGHPLWLFLGIWMVAAVNADARLPLPIGSTNPAT
jgi:hypothetical protein